MDRRIPQADKFPLRWRVLVAGLTTLALAMNMSEANDLTEPENHTRPPYSHTPYYRNELLPIASDDNKTKQIEKEPNAQGLARTVSRTACTLNSADGWNYSLIDEVKLMNKRGQIDHIWHGLGQVEATAADGCIKGITVKSYLARIPASFLCARTIKGPEEVVNETTPTEWRDASGNVVRTSFTASAETNVIVPYYDQDGKALTLGGFQAQADNSTDAQDLSKPCISYHYNIVSHTEGYFKNPRGQFLRFFCEEVSREVLATPTGSTFIGDPTSRLC